MVHDDDSFYLYGVGEKPDALTLGSLVLEKYWQPLIARHYTHDPLRGQDLEKNVWSSELKNCVFHGRSRLSPGVGVGGLDIVDMKLAWSQDEERVVIAKSGRRMILKEPETFLIDQVLASPKANALLKLWLSSARSQYFMNMRWARRPKIWLLTGLYVLEGTRTVVRTKTSTDVSVELSSAVVGALSGVPVGGSVSLGVGNSWEMQMEMEEQHVWAAQYRLLDAQYISIKTGEQPMLPATMTLYKDVMSVAKKKRRGGGGGGGSGRRGYNGDFNRVGGVGGAGGSGGYYDEEEPKIEVQIGLKPIPDNHSQASPGYSQPEAQTRLVDEVVNVDPIERKDGATGEIPDEDDDEEEESEEAFEAYEKALEEAIQMYEIAPPEYLS